MKLIPTTTTTFLIAATVFAFSASPALANEEINKGFRNIGHSIKCNFEGLDDIECEEAGRLEAQFEELQDPDGKTPDQPYNEKDVVDSGDEDSASAADANEQ
ncbi:MAG: hypothetical protein OXF05_05035 [Hyphomicrobiales bacterium]|nr:hypothetical protein [Hyphomicrobiales bacterium]MCY4033316.1 hypothetical protein [Hyphomicrobiales bacterium]MCY4038507.1 hypothetical protein [Hyphomicrobiales bacterium]